MMLKRVLSLSLLVAAGASCSGASGAGYQGVWIEVTELAPNDVPLDTEGHCLTLPLLLGSRVEHTFESETELEISAEATRDEFTITVDGAQSVSTSHDVEELEEEFSETFEVTSDSGVTYVIRLQSGC
jgi:hypothetical protein